MTEAVAIDRGDQPSESGPAGWRKVAPAELKTMLDRDEAILIDVREPVEHARESIEPSRLVPLSEFDAGALPEADGRTVVVHCNTGNRSRQAIGKLGGRVDDVAELEGGIQAWKQAGLPTRFNPKAPISIMRQVQITAGSLVLLGVVLGAFVSPWFLVLSGFVGAGLTFAGVSGWCGMATLLGRMPWNRVEPSRPEHR